MPKNIVDNYCTTLHNIIAQHCCILFSTTLIKPNLISRHPCFYVSRNYLARSLPGGGGGAIHSMHNNKKKIQVEKEMLL